VIAHIIRWSAANRLLVLLGALFITLAGAYSVSRTPLDAIPDLSDVQVIVRTPYPGQAPEIVEAQVTYPLTTTMLSVPKVKAVRGYSFFGDSYVTVIFEDGTDLYWARSRTLEYLSQAGNLLPEGVSPALGPDATGVGWAFQYALVDRTGQHDLGQLRALQDWFLKYQLKEIPGVAEVASLGGMVRAYQIQLDPDRMQIYGVSAQEVIEAVQQANNEAGGAVIERAEAEYMVTVGGYLEDLDDFRNIPLSAEGGTAVTIGDVARVQIVPDFRRGIAELNGEGEVVGGIIVVRQGADTLSVIERVKEKLAEIKDGLPPGVEVVTTYDRSSLIERAVENLWEKLFEEFLVVALVTALFLLHLRSALVAIIMLPLGVLAAFTVMYFQGVNANIMSLGGIAIAIGAMVDAAVVMIENAHKKLEHAKVEEGTLTEPRRRQVLTEAAVEVGPALFFSLLIITLSFLPVFTLEAQEGRLFKPLAFTKTYAMAAAAGLSITLVPVLMLMFIKGRIRPESDNPVNRALIAAYRPGLAWVLRRPKLTVGIAAAALALSLIPASQLGGEFMPPMNEGDILYMPTALPGLSASKASELLQVTDRIIKTVPEVKTVFGKAGRADTATDPAPLEMFETMIQLKPKSEWRPGMTMETIIEELDSKLRIPGLANVFVQPIRNRIDMLATGIKTPVGVKISGPDLGTLDRLGRQAVVRFVDPVGLERVGAAEREVEDHELGRVEDPFAIVLHHRPGGAVDGAVVDGEHDLAVGPFDRVDVPLGDVRTIFEEVLVHQRGLARVAGAVQRDADPVLLAHVFEDVYFAAVRPVAVAEEPERRPHPGRVGHPDAGGRAAVGEVELAAGVDPARDEVGHAAGRRLEAFAETGLQHEHAVFRAGHRARGEETDRLRRVDIDLLLVVHPEFGADDVPLAAVE